MNNVWGKWIYHIISAGVSGASSSLGAALIDPQSFNIKTKMGWEHIGGLALFGFAVPVLQILKEGLPKEN